MKTKINYIKGDATNPQGKGNKLILHVCNDIGGWGRGFVLALSKKWKNPEKEYRNWYKSQKNFELGQILPVQVEEDLWVINMIGQRDVKRDKDGTPPVRYEAIQLCIQKVAKLALKKGASIHLPRIGCGLAGGDWAKVEPILINELTEKDIEVTVYDFE